MPVLGEMGNSYIRPSLRRHSPKDSLTICEQKRYGLWRHIAASLLWVQLQGRLGIITRIPKNPELRQREKAAASMEFTQHFCSCPAQHEYGCCVYPVMFI